MLKANNKNINNVNDKPIRQVKALTVRVVLPASFNKKIRLLPNAIKIKNMVVITMIFINIEKFHPVLYNPNRCKRYHYIEGAVMDQLLVQGLKVKTTIGVHAWEKQIIQQLLIDITIHTHLQNCQDLLINTIDYACLCDMITSYVTGNTFNLIETVATNIGILIHDNFKRGIKTIAVTVSKPSAIKHVKNIAVTITKFT